MASQQGVERFMRRQRLSHSFRTSQDGLERINGPKVMATNGLVRHTFGQVMAQSACWHSSSTWLRQGSWGSHDEQELDPPTGFQTVRSRCGQFSEEGIRSESSACLFDCKLHSSTCPFHSGAVFLFSGLHKKYAGNFRINATVQPKKGFKMKSLS